MAKSSHDPGTGSQRVGPKEIELRVWPGLPSPLGATWDGHGVNFALFSETATRVELCLFDGPDARRESHCIELPYRSGHVWHARLPDIRPGQLYGYRVDGEWDPEHGLLFNRKKVLLDPYAKAIGRELRWHGSLFNSKGGELGVEPDSRDSAAWAPLGAVVNDAFYWRDDRPPRVPWKDTLIYEVHTRGATMLHPRIPVSKRGTWAGLASAPFIRHLKQLGVTAVELLPVHHFVQDRFLIDRGLSNYWGYNTLGFFAPEPRYASATTPQDAVREFKRMVRTLHRHGIEVLLDVVYNHTAEGNGDGPTLSMKGIDNQAYYRVSRKDARHYDNFTGCGNSINVNHPHTLQLILDSLRYWVQEMHVDGFRFDLASVLARDPDTFSPRARFLEAVHQDPVLSQVKLIAEPWDAVGSYDVGGFPAPWREWNGPFRDTVREFWRGDEGRLRELATRMCGSADLFGHNDRGPLGSINLVTAHDGFPLADLVSYEKKHNKANKEDSGEDHNRSWNCGHEGPTNDTEISRLRERQRRNLLVTLVCSQGVPMLLGGDEFGRTQQGNNNAYCQDNEISWLHWEHTESQKEFLTFVRRVTRLWRDHPVFHRATFFQHPLSEVDQDQDIHWLAPEGRPMTPSDWEKSYARCVGMLLVGRMNDEFDTRGERIIGESVLLLLNASDHDIDFQLPAVPAKDHWEATLDTYYPRRRPRSCEGATSYPLRSRSVAVLVHREHLWERLRRKTVQRRGR